MTDASFWNNAARGYAKRPISNVPAYEQTLDHVRRHLRSDQTALEVGCGTGSTALLLAPHVARYTGTDLSSEMIAIANEKQQVEQIEGLTFSITDADLATVENSSIDVLLAFNLYHLVPDLAKALQAAHQKLRPGGLFITKTPCVGKRWYLKPVLAVMRAIGKAPNVLFLKVEDYDNAIDAAGFDIIETALYSPSTPSRFVVARKR